MSDLLKIPSHIRQEFLRRLYAEGLSDQDIDLVIEDMWSRFEVGEYSVKQHNKVRAALEVSNPLSTKFQKKWKDYWERLPTLGVRGPKDKGETLVDRLHRKVESQIRWIERRIVEMQADGKEGNDLQHVERLYQHLHRFNGQQLNVIERYLGKNTDQENATSETKELQRLIALFGEDGSLSNGNHALPGTNGDAAGKI